MALYLFNDIQIFERQNGDKNNIDYFYNDSCIAFHPEEKTKEQILEDFQKATKCLLEKDPERIRYTTGIKEFKPSFRECRDMIFSKPKYKLVEPLHKINSFEGIIEDDYDSTEGFRRVKERDVFTKIKDEKKEFYIYKFLHHIGEKAQYGTFDHYIFNQKEYFLVHSHPFPKQEIIDIINSAYCMFKKSQYKVSLQDILNHLIEKEGFEYLTFYISIKHFVDEGNFCFDIDKVKISTIEDKKTSY